MVIRQTPFSPSGCLQLLLLAVTICAIVILPSCQPAGPPPLFGTLWIGIYDPMIGQPGVPCLIAGTSTPCPAPSVVFAGHTSSPSPGGFNTCFVAKEFGGTLPAGFPPSGFPSCSTNNGVQVTVSWTSNSTSSGWQINATAGTLQPGSWSIAWQTPLLNNNKTLTCGTTVIKATSTQLNSCP